jgi:LmbE family N-acetylglucosaminyl deacetylase
MKRYRGRLMLVHITDGSPLDLRYARAVGFRSREQYALTRRTELYDALALAGVNPRQCLQLSIADRQAYRFLPGLIACLFGIARTIQPTLLLSPPYEGGHPDHDAAAFAAAAIRRRFGMLHREYRLYHCRPDGSLETQEFLQGRKNAKADRSVEIVTLSPAERDFKAEMLRAFRTQSETLQQFQIADERFRRAPEYDFSRPPHNGPLTYERWNLGVSGVDWRRYACASLAR